MTVQKRTKLYSGSDETSGKEASRRAPWAATRRLFFSGFPKALFELYLTGGRTRLRHQPLNVFVKPTRLVA